MAEVEFDGESLRDLFQDLDPKKLRLGQIVSLIITTSKLEVALREFDLKAGNEMPDSAVIKQTIQVYHKKLYDELDRREQAYLK